MPNDFQALLQFTKSHDFNTLVDHCRPSRTILGVLQDAFHENVLSRLLRFFSDSSEAHELGDKFVRQWLKSMPYVPVKLGKGRYKINAHFNWLARRGADTARYVDLVLVISRAAKRSPEIILGIETKINAPESNGQIQDYQSALNRQFNSVPTRALLYLTPDGKPNSTGRVDKNCPCFEVSYESIISTCNAVRALNGTKQAKVLLEDLSQFLARDVMKDKSKAQIGQLLRKLEADQASARALSILRGSSYPATIRTLVYEQLLPRIREDFEGVEVGWHFPHNNARPNEFNFRHKDIQAAQPRGIDLFYMIYSNQKEPQRGDSVFVLLMAFSKAKNRKFSALTTEYLSTIRRALPPPEGELRQWGPWFCLWASAGHTLTKLDVSEAEEITELYVRAVHTTKSKLLRGLKGKVSA